MLDGVSGEGLLLQPAGTPRAYVIAIPDADQTPEQIVGLAPGVAGQSQFARQLALAGFQVVAPVLLDRSDEWSGSVEASKWTNMTHREWIYRQAYHMGRHIIGYEVQKVLAVVDWFKQQAGKEAKVGVVGYDEGGLLALYAAACDPRIDACLCSGYFQSRQQTWTEPLYRNVWSLLSEFGDAEIATLVAPRGLVIEHSEVPAVPGPPPVRAEPRQVRRRRPDRHARPTRRSPASSIASTGCSGPAGKIRHLVAGDWQRTGRPWFTGRARQVS